MKRLSYLAASGATFLLSALLTTAAIAATNDGAFDKLSQGNQNIAQALFDAEKTNPDGTKTLSRDDIAAMKENGKGWGEVFKQMKADGLVQDKNLGQVVSRFEHNLHQNRQGLKGDIKEDRRDLREDRRELREDIRSGASGDKIQADRQDIRDDVRDLKQDRQDLRTDRSDFNRPDRPERPERPHRR